MSFLYPLFMFGAAAISLPIIFHLIRRSSRERLPFSSLLFLSPSPPRITKRSRLEHLWLLLLRCLILLLLAFAFARPYIQRPVEAGLAGDSAEKTLILLDISASMKRSGLWPAAEGQLRQALNEIQPELPTALYSFDSKLNSVLEFSEWSAIPVGDRVPTAINRLSQLDPGWGPTHLDNALSSSIDLLDETAKISDENPENQIWNIVVITDLQSGTRLDALQGYEWPKGCQVRFDIITSSKPTNAGLQVIHDTTDFGGSLTEITTRIRIVNSTESEREQFTIGWHDGSQTEGLANAEPVYVPPGKSRVMPAPDVPNEATGERIVLNGDDESFDNTAWLVPVKARESTVLYMGDATADNTDNLLYYLRSAFQQTRRHVVDVKAVPPNQPLLQADIDLAQLIVVGEPPSDAVADQLQRHVNNGATVLFVMSDAQSVAALATIAAEPGLTATEGSANRYAMFGQIDFKHPLFASFADPRYSDFTKIHFWRHRKLDVTGASTAQVLAHFDNDNPAIVEIPNGKGTVVVLTTSWRPSDSQFALSSKFVPLLYTLLDRSEGLRQVKTQYIVGEIVDLSSLNGDGSLVIQKPDGNELDLSGESLFRQTDQPGIYSLNAFNPPVRFVVNLSPLESKTEPLDIETLEHLGIPLSADQPTELDQAAVEKEKILQATEIESRQKYWRWLVIAALGIVLLESLLAGRITRGVSVPQ